MMLLLANQLSPLQKELICKLWNEEYPVKLRIDLAGLEKYLHDQGSPKHFIVPGGDAEIKGWALTFERDSERWFSIIISRQYQGKGIGQFLLDKMKEQEIQLNGWVIDHDTDMKYDGQLYKSPLQFYLKNGFTLIPEASFESDIISAVKISWNNPASNH